MRALAVATGILLAACSSQDGDERSKAAPQAESARAQRTRAAWPPVGTVVATRTYGVGKVVKADDRAIEVEGKQGQKLLIPRDKLDDMLRPLVDEATADQMLAILREGSAKADRRPWGQRYKEYMANIRAGDPIGQARALRTLYATSSPLSFGEAKLAAQIELLIFDEIARAKGTTVEALEKEFYGRHPMAAPRSKREPLKGDCWMRFCFESIEVEGARAGKDVWLEVMRNGNRFHHCLGKEDGYQFSLEASVDGAGRLAVAKLESRAPAKVSECVREELAKIPIRGPASGPTKVRFRFVIEAVDSD
jgi:RNA polymerase-interacting CarD/CdnL/TRCF family regulator